MLRPPETECTPWSYAGPSGGITDTADDAVAAAAASTVHYLCSLQLSNADASVSTEVVIKDGSTVIWRQWLPAGDVAAVGNPNPVSFVFDPPLRSTRGAALNVAAITTSSMTYVNAQGFSAGR